ncbi:ABC transporter permease subunit [Streptomyces sp. NBC_00247]|uniref:ABC transporter permease subunit n=1 Tax=Streptomyces sp. NBC_00247 TaxID=2975689 RepID=UPI002E2D7BBD|nr:ABC transporter permease subunit [Streptomyces sp. NBC_00247]
MTTTTLTDPTTGAGTVRRGPLRGLAWLVVRQHRATLYCVLALVVLGAAVIAYERGQMIDTLDAAGWPRENAPDPVVSARVWNYVTLALGLLPTLLGVLVGAPLIASDTEQGTAQLVTTQSVARRRWLIAKLTLGYCVALFAGLVLSVLFTWWWKPYRSVLPAVWMDGSVFDGTGPVLPAFCLFLTAAGITIGVLLRRVLMAMVVTLGFSVFVNIVWDRFRDGLGTSHLYTYPLNAESSLGSYQDVQQLDSWVGSADGTLYGWGICAKATEAAQNACVKDKGIVNNVVEYLEYDQMNAMQWTGAAILLAATALLTVFVVWRVSRRPL